MAESEGNEWSTSGNETHLQCKISVLFSPRQVLRPEAAAPLTATCPTSSNSPELPRSYLHGSMCIMTCSVHSVSFHVVSTSDRQTVVSGLVLLGSFSARQVLASGRRRLAKTTVSLRHQMSRQRERRIGTALFLHECSEESIISHFACFQATCSSAEASFLSASLLQCLGARLDYLPEC